MSLTEILRWTEFLLAFSLLVQNLESIFLRRSFSAGGIWTWSLIRDDFSKAPKVIRKELDFLFSDPMFFGLLIFQLCLTLSLFFVSHAFILGTLFLLTLLISLRFRGAFNGGSDSMTLLTLMSLFLARTFDQSGAIASGALLYLSLQVILSYFISGVSKLKNKSWRDGSALSDLLKSNYYSVPENLQKKNLTLSTLKMASWSILIFECLFPIALINSTFCMAFLSAAFLFHLANIYIFGLNRFFYAWIATYPALVYCSHLWS